MPNLQTKFTADVVELQTKAAIAKAELASYSSEVTKLARAQAAGTLDGAGQAQLRVATENMLNQKAVLGDLGAQLRKAGVDFRGYGAAANESSVHVATAARHTKMLFHELEAGNMAGAEVSLLRLAQHMLGLGPAGLVGVGALAALALGAGYLAAKALEAAKEVEHIGLAAGFAGNLTMTEDVIKKMAESLSDFANISEADARKIIAAYASMPNQTNESILVMAQATAKFQQTTGANVEEAIKKMQPLLKPDIDAKKWLELADAHVKLTAPMRQLVEEAGAQHDRMAMLAAQITVLSSAYDNNTPKLAESKTKHDELYAAMSADASAIGPLEDANINYTKDLEDNTAALKGNLEELRQRVAALKAQGDNADVRKQTLLNIVQKDNTVPQQVDELQKKLAYLQDQKTKVSLDDSELKKVNADIADTQTKLTNLLSGPGIEKLHTDMAKIAEDIHLSNVQILTQQKAMLDDYLAHAHMSAAQRQTLERESASLEKELLTQQGAERLEALRTELAKIDEQQNLSDVRRLELKHGALQRELADTKLGYNQLQDVQRQFNGNSDALEKAKVANTRAIQNSQIQTDIAIRKMQIEGEKAALEVSFQNHKINAAQKAAVLEALTKEAIQLDIMQLRAEQATLDESSARWHELHDKIRTLEAQLSLDLKQIHRQQTADERNELNQRVSAWHTAVGEITNMESTMLSDLLHKRKSFGQSALQAFGQLVEQEIIKDVQWATVRLLLYRNTEAQKQAIAQGGLLVQFAREAQGVGATAAAEGAKTAAVTAGGEARVAAQASAATQGAAIQSALNTKSIMADAAKAYTGAYTAVVGIPYVGPILAPIAGGVAYAAVAAYEGLASLDVGAWDVPRDMTARIHQGESVVPKDFASGMRSAFAGAGGGSFGGGDFNQTNHFHSVMPSSHAIMGAVAKATRNFHPAALRGRRV